MLLFCYPYQGGSDYTIFEFITSLDDLDNLTVGILGVIFMRYRFLKSGVEIVSRLNIQRGDALNVERFHQFLQDERHPANPGLNACDCR